MSLADVFLSSERLTCPYPGPIVQYGTPRTATTFQWYLLCSIQRACALLNAPNGTSVYVNCGALSAPKRSSGLHLSV